MDIKTNGHPGKAPSRLFYRKQKLRGACWEYEISGGWITVPTGDAVRHILRHGFSFYRPRDATIRTANGTELVRRAAAEQWFFPDRWFSLLRFTTADDRTIGYYVNFSLPLQVVRENYYSDIDLELDYWLDLDGTVTELDRDEYEAEIDSRRLSREWADHVEEAAASVFRAIEESVATHGPNVEETRDPDFGIPEFILKA
jgi:protein associated with RNAse G/E